MTLPGTRLVRLLALAAIVAAGIACGEGPTAPSRIDQVATLAPGDTVQIDGADVGIRFDGVSNDSRCPLDALCILGGDATVHIAVLSGPTATPYELHTGNMLPVRHEELVIALQDVQPYPFSARPIDPAEYRVTLRVTR